MLRMRSSRSATCRTVRLGLTSLRRFAWSGGSRYRIESVDSTGRVRSVRSTPWPEQKVAGSFDTACTSRACWVIAQKPPASPS